MVGACMIKLKSNITLNSKYLGFKIYKIVDPKFYFKEMIIGLYLFNISLGFANYKD